MKKNIIFLLSIIFIFQACTKVNNTAKADYYTKEGYCIVNTSNQMQMGLNRFNTKKEFLDHCNGKMIFQFKENQCTLFTMKDMKFNIYIENDKNKYLFKVGEEKTICGKTIIESVQANNKH